MRYIALLLIAVGCTRESTPSSPAAHAPTGIVATTSDSVPPPPPPPPPAAKRDSVILRPGESVTVAGLILKFRSVPEDSRCPTGVQCVWEGNAAVRLDLAKAGASETVTVNSRIEPRAADFGGHRVRLLFLEPHPVYQQPTPPASYRAHLLVEPI